MELLTVLVVDADPLATRAIMRALEGESAIAVMGSAASVPEALEAIAQLQPDVVLLDAQLPSEVEFEAMRRIRDADPTQAVMVLSSVEDHRLAFRALELGAAGFLSKTLGIGVLPRIVRAVARGEAVLTRSLTTALVEKLRRNAQVHGP